ncbi:MAG TPA: hypothetical protein VN695_05765, partial [Streptosporangiaceae bacterium]|nr:hypothetical protein [Streptosporangiaceae bacterium]
ARRTHHEPPDETCGAPGVDVGADGADDGGLSLEVRDEDEVPEEEPLERDTVCCPLAPGSATAIPAVASTLAAVAEMATALTRARPRVLAAMSARV